jgi:hypothetical protein
MGGTACTRRQAQEFANAGIPAIGINTERDVVILPDKQITITTASGLYTKSGYKLINKKVITFDK